MLCIDDLFERDTSTDEFEYEFTDWSTELEMSPEIASVDIISNDDFHTLTGCEYSLEPENVFFITAFTGDDAIHFTNSHLFVKTMISIEKSMGIQISLKDTGISTKLGNFAEEWVLTPLTSEMSWEDTQAFHKGDGMPWAFDVVKLKEASSIRKSGGPEQQADPYDKVGNLCQRACWAVPGWLTYDDHQLLSLMGKCTLDITDGPFSPLLFSTEGGVGACPEWGNVISNVLLLGRFGQAKTLPGTFLIMKESTLINKGLIKPSDAYSTRLLHLSQTDFDLWKKFSMILLNPQSYGYSSEIDVWDNIGNLSGENIPPDLIDKSYVVKAQSFVEGTAISRLRTLGLIMTELDVRMELITYQRQQVIASDNFAGKALELLENRREKVKARPLKLYKTLVGKELKSLGVKYELKDMWSEIISVCKEYFSERQSSVLPYTAFSYRGETRIFKAEDVRQYAPTRNLGPLKEQLKGNIAMWVPMGTYDPREDKKFRLIENWVNSNDIGQMFSNPLPLGITTDDARLYSDMQILQRQNQGVSTLNIVVTNDRRLVASLQSLHVPGFDIRRLENYSYVALCRDIEQFQGEKNNRAPFYNILRQRYDKAPKTPPWGSNYDIVYFHFDVPNIEKGLRSLRFSHRTVYNDSSGYITKKAIAEHRNNGVSVYLLPWQKLYNLIRKPAELVSIPRLKDVTLRS